jgi:hypothetical protein
MAAAADDMLDAMRGHAEAHQQQELELEQGRIARTEKAAAVAAAELIREVAADAAMETMMRQAGLTHGDGA